MANSQPQYTRLSTVSTTGAETKVINSGTSGTDFIGGLDFPMNTLVLGDVFVLRAWGRVGSTSGAGRYQLRFFLNTTGGITSGVIATTGSLNIGQVNSNMEWYFESMFTIRTTGTAGTLWCDALQNSPLLSASSAQAGLGSSIGIDTTVDQYFDFSIAILAGTGNTVYCDQLSLEYLPQP